MLNALSALAIRMMHPSGVVMSVTHCAVVVSSHVRYLPPYQRSDGEWGVSSGS